MVSAPATQQDVINLRQDQKDHEKRDEEFQGKIFDILDDRFDKLDERFDKTDKKLDELWDEKNFREGAAKTQEQSSEDDERRFSRRERVITIFLGIATAFVTVKFSK